MVMQILGSELYTSRPIDPADFVNELPKSLAVHTTPPEASDALDPLTYEVVRHRLWSVTDEMASTSRSATSSGRRSRSASTTPCSSAPSTSRSTGY